MFSRTECFAALSENLVFSEIKVVGYFKLDQFHLIVDFSLFYIYVWTKTTKSP